MSDEELKMSITFVLEIKSTKNDKVFNFLNDFFSVMGGPMDMIFGVFSETIVRFLKYIISQFSQNIAKVITY